MIAQPDAWRKTRERKNLIFKGLCFFAAAVASLLLVTLLFFILRDGLGRLNWDFITSFPSRRAARAGIYASMIGTLWIVGLTALFAIPVGISAAIYLEEIAPKNRFTRFIEVNIANLAGVPSIIYGLLGLAVFVRFFGFNRSILAASLTMTLLVLPTVIITCQEALRAVPRSLREGSLALGSTPWQTILRQTLPSAIPGIMTGMILSISRAIGETAPLIAVGAVVFVQTAPKGPSDTFTALPIQIFDWSSRPQAAFHENAAAGIIVLLAVLFAMNLLAILTRNWARKRLS